MYCGGWSWVGLSISSNSRANSALPPALSSLNSLSPRSFIVLLESIADLNLENRPFLSSLRDFGYLIAASISNYCRKVCEFRESLSDIVSYGNPEPSEITFVILTVQRLSSEEEYISSEMEVPDIL